MTIQGQLSIDKIVYMIVFIFFFRIFSFLDVVTLCRCAKVSKYWNDLALDGSNWQRVDLFEFQRDIEVYTFH